MPFDLAGAADLISKLMARMSPHPTYGWSSRPITNLGQQVSDGDRVVLRCNISNIRAQPSWIPTMGKNLFGDDQMYVKLVDMNGTRWAKAEKGDMSSAAHFEVRESEGGNFNLVEVGTGATLAQSGHWVKAETGVSEGDASIACLPSAMGYELYFQSGGGSVSSSEWLNCKGEGTIFTVFFFLV